METLLWLQMSIQSKLWFFLGVLYRCESWTIKKAEHWQIDAFELWCWIRLLRVPWTARRSNQSILEEVNPKYSLEGLMLKLTLRYFGHWMQRATHWKRPWCWEWLKMGGEGGDRGWDGWMASPTRWAWLWARSGRWWRRGSLDCCSPRGHEESDVTEWMKTTAGQTWLSEWKQQQESRKSLLQLETSRTPSIGEELGASARKIIGKKHNRKEYCPLARASWRDSVYNDGTSLERKCVTTEWSERWKGKPN